MIFNLQSEKILTRLIQDFKKSEQKKSSGDLIA